MTSPELRPVEILLVEDSPTDVLLAKEALEFSKVVNRLHVVTDGVEAMAFLRKDGPYHDAPPTRSDPSRPEFAPEGWP